jgi:uncharacterized damage-inducible protein DinB
MKAFLEDYLGRLAALHQGVKDAVADLPSWALDWTPGSDMNSMAVLATHLAGAERYWIGDMVGQDPSGRVRATEFQARDVDSEMLSELLDRVFDHSQGVLNEIGLEDLGTTRLDPRDGERYTVAWCLHHALEHTAIHLGHLQVTRQLYDRRPL